jgi:hypothetical protein
VVRPAVPSVPPVLMCRVREDSPHAFRDSASKAPNAKRQNPLQRSISRLTCGPCVVHPVPAKASFRVVVAGRVICQTKSMIRSIITAIRVPTKASPTTAYFRLPDNNGTVVARTGNPPRRGGTERSEASAKRCSSSHSSPCPGVAPDHEPVVYANLGQNRIDPIVSVIGTFGLCICLGLRRAQSSRFRGWDFGFDQRALWDVGEQRCSPMSRLSALGAFASRSRMPAGRGFSQ